MSETAAAPAPVAQEPTKIPPPTQAGSQGSAALVDEPKKAETPWSPKEYELEINGKKQKVRFDTEDQLKAVLQKAGYADQVIKEAVQAKRGSEALYTKLKAVASGDVDAFDELMSDPDFKGDTKKIGLEIVKRMMEREKRFEGWTPEQVKMAERAELADKYEAENKSRAEAEAERVKQEKITKDAQEFRTQIIAAMEKYPDIPKTQATMDAVIQNMRAAFRRFGKHLTPDQAMTVYSEQYWQSLGSVLEKMEPDKILNRFGQKTLDKIQKYKLEQLKEKTDPSKKTPVVNGEMKKKKHLTEKDFDKHFSQNIAPLAGL
jgi:hypothetical protein